MNKYSPNTHHDALEFLDSQIVLLTLSGNMANKQQSFSFQWRLAPKLKKRSLQIRS
jgi:hypothetical protein